jgi:cytoskeletal protein CcmA (bactofilin family)
MTTLGPSLTITGDITCQEDMTIHGTVKGTITMQQGTLVVAQTGIAEANVNGSTITVHGKVSGDVTATEKLELTDSAFVSGTISAPSLLLREGAVFNGIIDMSVKKGSAVKPGAPKLTVVEPAAKAS